MKSYVWPDRIIRQEAFRFLIYWSSVEFCSPLMCELDSRNCYSGLFTKRTIGFFFFYCERITSNLMQFNNGKCIYAIIEIWMLRCGSVFTHHHSTFPNCLMIITCSIMSISATGAEWKWYAEKKINASIITQPDKHKKHWSRLILCEIQQSIGQWK